MGCSRPGGPCGRVPGWTASKAWDALPHAAAARGVRLGRIETRLLEEVGRLGGIAPRDAVLHAIYPDLGPRPAGGASSKERKQVERWVVARALAESTVSRSIGSLQRKGLIVTERFGNAGPTIVRDPSWGNLPSWEQAARREQDLAVRLRELAQALLTLGDSARRRAAAIRASHSDPAAAERDSAEQLWRKLDTERRSSQGAQLRAVLEPPAH